MNLPNIQAIVAMLALASGLSAQSPQGELSEKAQAKLAKIEATKHARAERERAQRRAIRQQAFADGANDAKKSRTDDLTLAVVWNGLTPAVRELPNAKAITRQLAKQPEWKSQTPAERIAAATARVTNDEAIRNAEKQAAMGTKQARYPKAPDVNAKLVVAAGPPAVKALKKSKAPDLFSVNLQHTWNKPHGQWMTRMLKDINAAKAAGDTETYNTLTARYSAWAEKYLRR